MTTLYITPEYLTNFPSSIDWNIIPAVRATPQQMAEAQTEICQRGTAFADAYCGQVLRATLNNEQAVTGDGRLTVDPQSGNGVYRTRFSPVLSVVSAQVSNNGAFPPSFTSLPSTGARPRGAFNLDYPFPNAGGEGPRFVDLQPGYVTTNPQTLLQLVYVNGFPHAAMKAVAAAQSSTLSVDEVVGFAGATGWLYDTTSTELVSVSSVTATNGSTGAGAYGPGTLNLSAPTAYAHNATVLFSCFPADLLEGVVFACFAATMMRGSSALVMAQTAARPDGGGNTKAATYLKLATDRLKPYRCAR